MDGRETRRALRGFYRRHRSIWEFVRQTDPSFWIDLEETAREIRELQWTRSGSVVRGWPETRDAATEDRPATRNAAT